jgi:ribosomal protein S18 acetylase RimI-like enzyme
MPARCCSDDVFFLVPWTLYFRTSPSSIIFKFENLLHTHIALHKLHKTTMSMEPSADTSAQNPSMRLRRFEAQDLESIIEIFQANLVEEWTRYHDSKYLSNAKKYVEETITGRNSDLLNIDQVYLKTGGEFSVLVSTKDNKVFGMCGLERVSPTEGELRRMCLRPCVRRLGWGTRMARMVQAASKEMGLQKLIVSTPEHGDDVLQFYAKQGFVDTGKREPIHNSPIQEVFLEWKVL